MTSAPGVAQQIPTRKDSWHSGTSVYETANSFGRSSGTNEDYFSTSNSLPGDKSAHEAASSADQFQSEFDYKEWATNPPTWHYGNQWRDHPYAKNFEVLHNASLAQDAKQCTTWKEEVENLLILAALFSGVVTAFIMKSLPTLRSDPNDQIISILSRIADQMSTPAPNASTHTSPLATTPAFVPVPSNVRINVVWFISLVLSLTVALIGIITLQWLRAHQVYENSTDTMQAFAVFNARRDSLRRWYVPQIFAGLPLLLQAALVLFFVGLAEFLFSVHIDVAIPVSVVIAIPILFLAATTVLPTLQLYSLHLPYLLRLNDHVPAPCSYKSPQSLIFQRVFTASKIVFNLFAWVFGLLWTPCVVAIRLFSRSSKPFYGKSAPFGTNNSQHQSFFDGIRNMSGSWVSMDSNWLAARTSYSVAMHTPSTGHHLQWPYHHTDFEGVLSSYDGLNGIKFIFSSTDPNNIGDGPILLGALDLILERVCNSWELQLREASNQPDIAEALQAHIMAILRMITPYNYQPTENLVSLGIMPLIKNAFVVLVLDQSYPSEFDFGRRETFNWLRRHIILISGYLSESAHDLFLCSNIPGIIPSLSLSTRQSLSDHRDYLERYNLSWMYYMSDYCTYTLKNVIIDTRGIRPHTQAATISTGSVTIQYNDGFYTKPIVELTEYILLFQVREDIKDTLCLLYDLAMSKPKPLQDRPCVLIIACAYINAVANVNQDDMEEFRMLLHMICELCGSINPTLEARPGGTGRHWPKMESAFDYIHDHCIPGH